MKPRTLSEFSSRSDPTELTNATIGLHPDLHLVAQWAWQTGIYPIFSALLDSAKSDRHPEYFGTILKFLNQEVPSRLLYSWSDESICAGELHRFAQACAVSPLIAQKYPAMPSLKPVSRQLTGGDILTKLSMVALVARPIQCTVAVDVAWLEALRTWFFL